LLHIATLSVNHLLVLFELSWRLMKDLDMTRFFWAWFGSLIGVAGLVVAIHQNIITIEGYRSTDEILTEIRDKPIVCPAGKPLPPLYPLIKIIRVPVPQPPKVIFKKWKKKAKGPNVRSWVRKKKNTKPQIRVNPGFVRKSGKLELPEGW
jgi:hypothetical protein